MNMEIFSFLFPFCVKVNVYGALWTHQDQPIFRTEEGGVDVVIFSPKLVLQAGELSHYFFFTKYTREVQVSIIYECGKKN